jgi:hypothetical protein
MLSISSPKQETTVQHARSRRTRTSCRCSHLSPQAHRRFLPHVISAGRYPKPLSCSRRVSLVDRVDRVDSSKQNLKVPHRRPSSLSASALRRNWTTLLGVPRKALRRLWVLQELLQSRSEQDGVSLSVILGEDLQVPLRVALFVFVELVDRCCCFPLVKDWLQFLRPERHCGGCCGSFFGIEEMLALELVVGVWIACLMVGGDLRVCSGLFV